MTAHAELYLRSAPPSDIRPANRPDRLAAQASQVQPPRQLLPRVIRRPVQPARHRAAHTDLQRGPERLAGTGHWSYASPAGIRRSGRPLIIHTRPLPNIPPPTQRWQPSPLIIPDPARSGRWHPTQVRTQPGRLSSAGDAGGCPGLPLAARSAGRSGRGSTARW